MCVGGGGEVLRFPPRLVVGVRMTSPSDDLNIGRCAFASVGSTESSMIVDEKGPHKSTRHVRSTQCIARYYYTGRHSLIQMNITLIIAYAQSRNGSLASNFGRKEIAKWCTSLLEDLIFFLLQSVPLSRKVVM